jgi:hypothetical protein
MNTNIFSTPKQEKTIKDLISLLGDVRSDDTELRGNLSKEKRSDLLLSRRKSLDKIELIEEIIDKYIRKIT